MSRETLNNLNQFFEVNQQTPVVFLVDDQPMVAEAVRRMLAHETDIKFFYCADSTKAIQQAQAIKPTVILQDLVMPSIDGFTLVENYRKHYSTATTPIIVLSNKEDPQDKSHAFELGASDYLVKLPDKIELIARIRAHSKTYLMQQERDEAFRRMRFLQNELEESNAQLQRLTCLDGLTGIANRRRFDEFLQNEWLRTVRARAGISIILVDIDSFKLYNDNYGHQKGDECLSRVAQALSTSLNRPTDLVARYGGEEFVVVLPDTLHNGARLLSENLRANVESLKIVHAYSSVSKYVTISLGVACMRPTAQQTAKYLIELADQALYRAKSEGKNQVVIASLMPHQEGG